MSSSNKDYDPESPREPEEEKQNEKSLESETVKTQEPFSKDGKYPRPSDYMEPTKKRLILNLIMGFLLAIVISLVAVTMVVANKNVGKKVKRVNSSDPTPPGPHPEPEPEPQPEPQPLEQSNFLKKLETTSLAAETLEVDALEVDGDSIDKNRAKLPLAYYFIYCIEGIIIGLLGVYMVLSFFNKLSFKDSFATTLRKSLGISIAVIISGGLSAGFILITDKVILKDHITKSYYEYLLTEGEPTGFMTIDGETATLTEDYETSVIDESVVLAKNEAKVTLFGATVVKSGGDSSNTENSEFYGINAAFLASGNLTQSLIYSSTIFANATGSNAVFATQNAEITLLDTVITTTSKSSSRGLDSTYGGHISAKNVTITTQGGSCATLATDRGEGYVTCTSCHLTTNGAGSPVIYSTGVITLIDSEGNSNGAQCVVIEGKNTANVQNSQIISAGTGNRGEVDECGVMIYQSMSGDASVGTGTFNCENSFLQVTTEGIRFFFITNTEAVINLKKCDLSFSGNFMDIQGTSEWGKEGENGGNVTLNAYDQVIEGNITVDNISKLNLNLYGSSKFIGMINNAMEGGKVYVTAEENCTIELTGDSYVNSYEGPEFNGTQFIIINPFEI